MEPIGRRKVMRHRLVNVHRYPKGTPYPEIYHSVKQVLAQLPPRDRWPELVVDGTGVGAPVVDAMREIGMHPLAVVITGGRTIKPHSARQLHRAEGPAGVGRRYRARRGSDGHHPAGEWIAAAQGGAAGFPGEDPGLDRGPRAWRLGERAYTTTWCWQPRWRCGAGRVCRRPLGSLI